MATRTYVAPPDDPNGNAGKVITTDDNGNFSIGGYPSSPSAPAANTSSGSHYNADAESGTNQVAIAAANQAYNMARLQLVDVPMLQIEKDKIAHQAAQFAAQMAFQDKRLRLIDQPMEELDRQKLIHQITQDAIDSSLKGEIGRGDLGLRAAGAADQMDLARQAQGLAGAHEYANQGFQAADLISRTRGPRNAFQQQRTMNGLNAAGLTRAVDAIAGTWSNPAFRAPQASPERATLDSMAEDMVGAGGVKGLSPADLAFIQAQRNTMNPVSANSQLLSNMARRESGGSAVAAAGGQPVQQVPQAPPDLSGIGQKWNQLYQQMSAKRGGASIPANDPEFIAAAAAISGMTPQEVLNLTTVQATDYVRATGKGPDEATVQKWVEDAFQARGANGMAGTGGAGGFTAPAAGGATQPGGGDGEYGPGYSAYQNAGSGAAPTGGRSAQGGGYAMRYDDGSGAGDQQQIQPYQQRPWWQQQAPGDQAMTGGFTAPPAGPNQADQYNGAFPAPNRIVSRNWDRLGKDSQDFLLSGYEDQGYSGNDVQDAIDKTRVGRRSAYGLGGVAA